MSGVFSKKVAKKRRSAASSFRASNDPGYLVDVVEKLRNHEDYKTKSHEELRQKAKELTDVDELRADFSHLTDLPFEQYAGEIAVEADVFLYHPREKQQAKNRAVKRLCPPSIKLYLFELKRPVTRFFSRFSKLFALQYGPLHAAIQVDDVVLQWGTSSLVIPDRYDPADPVFLTDVNSNTAAAQVATALQTCVSDSFGQIDYNEQIELQFDLAVNVEEMIDKIKAVIVNYNKYRYYNVILCNCQSFVDDVMKAIGVKNVPQNLTGKLKGYFKQLTTDKSKALLSDFPTHESLDEYVATQDLPCLTQHDKEYLLCLYFQFHLEAMKTDKDSEEECQVPGCLMARIELSLETIKTLLLESYASK